MPRFSANLSLLFTELPFLKRFEAAQECGFKAVEIQFPYEHSAFEIQTAIDHTGLEPVLFNVPAGDLMSGGEGLAAVPSRRSDFKAAVDRALEYARILKPRIVNVLPGRCLQDDRRIEYLKTFEDNLSFAAERFAMLGISVVFEAVNTRDMPGFLVSSTAAMLDVLDHLNLPNLLMQYDVYHMQVMGEDHIDIFSKHAARIGHVQFADAPGRGEPGTGNIDFRTLFGAIDESCYHGWLGAEYRPTIETKKSLGWMNAYR